MKTIHVSAERVIDAPAAVLYDLAADYEDGHPRILPAPYLSNLRVEQGGRGAGTVITCDLRMMGQRLSFRSVVSEPEPGRVLQEVIPDNNTVTQFIFDPAEGGSTRVRIETQWPSPGWRAPLERWLLVPFFRKAYDLELANLAREAQHALVRKAELIATR